MNYHGGGRTKNYFEGWYCKHQSDSETIAVIPGVQMSRAGEQSAFIQVVTQENSWHFLFPFQTFAALRHKFSVRIGKNLFCESGMLLDICQNGVSIRGKIDYGPFTPIAYGIMGPFSVLPFMECSHAIHSLRHTLQGSLLLDGRTIDLTNGRGYIEQDWGRNFPKKYAWIQANDFIEASFFLSLAKIPFMGCTFTGCICVLRCSNTEYRLATYLGVHILEWTERSVLLRQGKYTLQVSMRGGGGQKLLAPARGELLRTIHENPSCSVDISLYRDKQTVFCQTSHAAGYEYVDQ